MGYESRIYIVNRHEWEIIIEYWNENLNEWEML